MTSRDGHLPSQDEPGPSITQEQGQRVEGQTSLSEDSERSSSQESAPGPDVISPYETQSSNVSDITLRSRIPQTTGGDERSVESDARNSIDHAESSGSLTFHPHSHDRLPDESAASNWPPSSPPARHPVATQTEITEAPSSESGGEGAEQRRSNSEVSIGTSVPDTPSKRARPNPRKRRQFWLNLKRGGGNLRKRLCCCFSPKAMEHGSSSQGEGFKIRRPLERVDGIVPSHASMSSSTTRDVQEVIDEHGGLVVLSGERLSRYEDRLREMLDSYFDRKSGDAVLRLWREDASRPRRLHAEMLPSSSTEHRFLTLGDVRLLPPPRDEIFDPREDSIFRYFMSCEGLSQRMLIPGRA